MKADIPSLSIEKGHRLWWSCLIAFGLHALLVVPFLVTQERRSAPLNTSIEVTIANPDSEQRPERASFESLANQVGAGDNDILQRLRSQQLGRDANADTDASNNRKSPFDQSSDQTSKGWIAKAGEVDRVRTPGEIYLLSNASAQNQQTGAPDQNLLADLDLQTEQLRGQGQAQGATVATLQSTTAAYINRWRQRIETIGTRKSKQTRLLTGSVELWAKIGPQGQLIDYRVLQSSGDPKVDQAAKDILLESAPFDPFPTQMRAQQDQIEITRVWQFRLGSPTLRR